MRLTLDSYKLKSSEDEVRTWLRTAQLGPRTLWTSGELWELFCAVYPDNNLDKWVTFPRALRRAGVRQPWQGEPVRTRDGLRRLFVLGPRAEYLARCAAREVSSAYNQERGYEVSSVTDCVTA